MQNIIKLEEGGSIHFTKNTPPEYVRSVLIFQGETSFLKRVIGLFSNFAIEEIRRCFFYSGENAIHIFCTETQFIQILTKYFFTELIRDGTVKKLSSYKDLSVFDQESESFIYDYTFSEEELSRISEEKSLDFWKNVVIHDYMRVSNYSSTFEKFNINKSKL